MATKPARPFRRPPKRVTARDKHLVGVLAVARYLSTEQLWRLFMPGRSKRTLEMLLDALAGEGRMAVRKALIRRLVYRPYDAAPVVAWTPTAFGYEETERAFGLGLRQPRQDIGQQFLEHTVQLNALLVALLEPKGATRTAPKGHAPRGAFARADFAGFKWTASETTRLPWKAKDCQAGGAKVHVIQPDAILELPSSSRGADSASPPGARDPAPVRADPDLRFGRAKVETPRAEESKRAPGRRYFLECEMGTHTIAPVSPDKPNATLNKAARYAEYLMAAPGHGAKSFYEAQYADGFQPEVLFLVTSPRRAQSVNAALDAWRAKAQRALAARAVTFPDAAAELLEETGRAAASGPSRDGLDPNGALEPNAQLGRKASAPKPRRAFQSSDGPLVARFFGEAMERLQRARRQVRALPADVRQRLSLEEPAYPANAEEVQALVARLGGGGSA